MSVDLSFKFAMQDDQLAISLSSWLVDDTVVVEGMHVLHRSEK